MIGRWRNWPIRLAKIMTALAALVATSWVLERCVPYVFGHESPSGWPYPSDCCSKDGKECHPINASSVVREATGYRYRGLLFEFRNDGRLRISGDDGWHACESFEGGVVSVHCLIVPLEAIM